MNVEFQMLGFCPHCNNNSIHQYITHHVYDESQGGLWNGEPETNEQPGAYFLFYCQTCSQVLVYHFYPAKDEVDDILSFYEANGVKRLAIDADDLIEGFDLMYPAIFENIDKYVPLTVKKQYLKALRSIGNPNHFAMELRIALEVICEENGILGNDINNKSKNLYQRIGELAITAKLPSSVEDIAHKIRVTGNKADHSSDDLDPQIVPLLRNFFLILVNHIFVLPYQKHDWAERNL